MTPGEDHDGAAKDDQYGDQYDEEYYDEEEEGMNVDVEDGGKAGDEEAEGEEYERK